MTEYNIQSGDILALSHSEWDSIHDIQVQAVRTFTQSEFSHVCCAMVLEGRVYAIEAVEPKVRLMPLNNILKNEGVYWIPMNTPMTEDETEFVLSEVGVGAYSKWQAIAGQLEMLDIGSDSMYQCSELVIAQRRLSGIELGPKATPSKVIKKAVEMGNSIKYIPQGTILNRLV